MLATLLAFIIGGCFGCMVAVLCVAAANADKHEHLERWEK